jgi:8-oxo-dGTP diphosphatase
VNNFEKLNELGNSSTAVVVAILRDRKLLVGLRNYRHDLSVWTMPGGRCNEGETIEQALRRETAEEVGIIDLDIFGFVGKIPGAHEGDTLYIFAGSTIQEPKLMEPEKFSEWRWFGLDEMPNNFINQKSLELVRDFINK